jgi:hypothetical protein
MRTTFNLYTIGAKEVSEYFSMLKLSYHAAKPSSLSGGCMFLDIQKLSRGYVGGRGLMGTQVRHAMD